MDKKCTKYEGLFIFSDEETLNQHIQECPDCKAEHEKMQKVSDLLSEVKFHYRLRNRKVRKLRAICALSLVMFFTAGFGIISDDGEITDVIMYGETLSAEDLGLPVDSYGLIMVDDEF